ncbi:uncharacterized protein METZ01_LOCUS180633, partial [marine metagenome]
VVEPGVTGPEARRHGPADGLLEWRPPPGLLDTAHVDGPRPVQHGDRPSQVPGRQHGVPIHPGHHRCRGGPDGGVQPGRRYPGRVAHYRHPMIGIDQAVSHLTGPVAGRPNSDAHLQGPVELLGQHRGHGVSQRGFTVPGWNNHRHIR